MTRYWLLAGIAGLAALVAPAPGRADGFDARPILIESQDGLGAVVITNPGERKIYLETQIFDWSQDAAGKDVLTESDGAFASPPAMWVAPHSTYNLRVKLPKGAPGQERAFRVMIKQLPERSDITAGRIVFALTESLPAFAEADAMAPASLHARITGPRSIMISNDGGRRARLSDIVQDGRTIAPGLVGYALQHSALNVPLAAAAHAGAIDLETDGGHRTLDLR